MHLGIPIFFVILCLGLLLFSFIQEPKECGIGLFISAIGVPVYYGLIKNQEKHPTWLKEIMRKYISFFSGIFFLRSSRTILRKPTLKIDKAHWMLILTFLGDVTRQGQLLFKVVPEDWDAKSIRQSFISPPKSRDSSYLYDIIRFYRQTHTKMLCYTQYTDCTITN